MLHSNLTKRLKGIYTSGDDEIEVTRDFSNFIPPINLEASKRIEELEMVIREASEYLDYNELTTIGSGSPIHQSFKYALRLKDKGGE